MLVGLVSLLHDMLDAFDTSDETDRLILLSHKPLFPLSNFKYADDSSELGHPFPLICLILAIMANL